MSNAPGNNVIVRLTPEPLATAEQIGFVHDPVAGGVCIFLGTTRHDTAPDGRPLVALDYEAYDAMARQQLNALARRAIERWPIVKLVLAHRTGRVALGEASVLIAVSTPHRPEAFEACRWLIDTLKAEVTVWKREVWASGEGTWARPNKEWRGGAGTE